jgi:hypothetical protein
MRLVLCERFDDVAQGAERLVDGLCLYQGGALGARLPGLLAARQIGHVQPATEAIPSLVFGAQREDADQVRTCARWERVA